MANPERDGGTMDLMKPTVEQVVAAATKRDPSLGPFVELAANLLTAGEDIDVLGQAYLQDTLWWRVPKRLDPDDWQDAVAGAAALLEGLGLDRYAEIARSDKTARILEAWGEGPESGHAEALAARKASGLVAPDLEEFAWGSIMGGEESDALTAVEHALEAELVRSGLRPDGAAWKRRALEVTAEVINRPVEFPPGQTRLTMIITDRVESWIGAVRVPQLQRWRSEVANRLLNPIEPPEGVETMLAPMLWLLGEAAEGANLTQSQYLTPVTVRAAAERFGWWDHDRAPRSESEVHQLLHLREAATRLRLTRRTGRTLKLTKLGASSLADPVSLWRLVVPSLRGGDEFEAMMAELVGMRMVEGDAVGDALAEELMPVVNQLGWRTDEGSLDQHEVGLSIWDRWHWWRVIGVMKYQMGRWAKDPFRRVEPPRAYLTEAGAVTVLAYLRLRAIAPQHDLAR